MIPNQIAADESAVGIRGALDGITADDRDVEVLAHLHERQIRSDTQVSQRSIARALEMSVGLTNAILKRLVAKGLVMVQRVNHNNAHYLVTPQGLQQIGRRSYLYLRRTIGHVVRYKERLRQFCRRQATKGVREIVLVGESDLAFLLEWCAEKEGLRFLHSALHEYRVVSARGTQVIMAETIADMNGSNVVSLRQVVLGVQV